MQSKTLKMLGPAVFGDAENTVNDTIINTGNAGTEYPLQGTCAGCKQ